MSIWLIRVHNWCQGRSAIDPDALPVYGVALLLLCFATAGVVMFEFEVDTAFANSTALALITFMAIAVATRFVGFPRLAGVLESWMLLLAVAALTAIGTFIAAALNRPLLDGALARADYVLFGFSRAIMPGLTSEWPRTFRFFAHIYNTLSFQPFLVLAILFSMNHRRRAWRFLLAWSVALVLCLAVSPFVPARGSAPYASDWVSVLNGARNGTLRTIGPSALAGIVAFPSFHAAGAVVLAWGMSGVKHLRAPMVALNGLVIVSAVVCGSHYLMDIVAGIAVAAGAIGVTGWFDKRPAAVRAAKGLRARADFVPA